MAFTESSTQTENTDLNSNYSLEIQLLKIRLASALDPYLQTINYSEDHIECLHGAMLTLSKQVYDQITDPEKQAKEIRLIHASVSSLLEKTERKRTERTEVDRETEVEGSDLEDDTDNKDGSVDEDIWDRSVDPVCMDAGYERDDSDVNKNI
ncbi:hypothetical protein IFR04_006878 [Cadophora malorum]|uniref:Uncharacterized protein n=1 Tax=Cadophora malorum TaxID=108018 RepID=A0A8H7W962_9HELO|nr:hypothetical protein IFR04_006878 [Cadophora malorum]